MRSNGNGFDASAILTDRALGVNIGDDVSDIGDIVLPLFSKLGGNNPAILIKKTVY
jgi:hypothetical protein